MYPNKMYALDSEYISESFVRKYSLTVELLLSHLPLHERVYCSRIHDIAQLC